MFRVEGFRVEVRVWFGGLGFGVLGLVVLNFEGSTALCCSVFPKALHCLDCLEC